MSEEPTPQVRYRPGVDCRCKGYSQVHRQGARFCYANQRGPFCAACGQPCEQIASDAEMSSCCQSALFVDAELTERYG